jgi:glycerophosphoryl diester phosphodiesterase
VTRSAIMTRRTVGLLTVDYVVLPATTEVPVIIAHRGASGYRPEHTLAAYELAARLGADFLEPDLVSTRDGVLVARHEPEIGATTDVAQHREFADRVTSKVIDGRRVRGWFAEDFTLAELRTLRAVERIPALRQRNTLYDGRYPVPTFGEVVALAARLSGELGRQIGVYPETKCPSYHRSIGLPLEPTLVHALREANLDRPDAPVFVQSFEASSLRCMRAELKVPLVQLSKTERFGTAELAEIACYADVIGPAKELIVPRDSTGRSAEPSSLVTDAHAAGLAVHAWTFRNENHFLPLDLRSRGGRAGYGNALAEYWLFAELGVDGVFTDHPDTAASAIGELLVPRAS